MVSGSVWSCRICTNVSCQETRLEIELYCSLGARAPAPGAGSRIESPCFASRPFSLLFRLKSASPSSLSRWRPTSTASSISWRFDLAQENAQTPRSNVRPMVSSLLISFTIVGTARSALCPQERHARRRGCRMPFFQLRRS